MAAEEKLTDKLKNPQWRAIIASLLIFAFLILWTQYFADNNQVLYNISYSKFVEQLDVILAGGLSSRMKQFKPLLPLGGATITDQVIATFLICGIDVILVVGNRQEELRKVIKKWDITIIENPDYRRGMFSSIQTGIRCLQSHPSGFFHHAGGYSPGEAVNY